MGAGIGTRLRDAREARGLGLPDVHEVTRISVRHLEALEAERWDKIPGPAYVRGFLRTYAEFLGLDQEELLDGLEFGPDAERQELREPIIESGELPRARLIRPGPAAGIAVALIVLLLVILGGGDDEGGEPNEPQGAVTTETTTETTTSVPAAEPEPPADRATVVLRATGPVWVCLVDQRDRQLVAAETLAEGDRRGPFEARVFRLTTGNGQFRLLANDERVEVPESPDPLGFEIGPKGAKDLAEVERPECS